MDTCAALCVATSIIRKRNNLVGLQVFLQSRSKGIHLHVLYMLSATHHFSSYFCASFGCTYASVTSKLFAPEWGRILQPTLFTPLQTVRQLSKSTTFLLLSTSQMLNFLSKVSVAVLFVARGWYRDRYFSQWGRVVSLSVTHPEQVRELLLFLKQKPLLSPTHLIAKWLGIHRGAFKDKGCPSPTGQVWFEPAELQRHRHIPPISVRSFPTFSSRLRIHSKGLPVSFTRCWCHHLLQTCHKFYSYWRRLEQSTKLRLRAEILSKCDLVQSSW